ncbi:MAG: hypothetical protein ACRD0K_29450 [Egibacteraceae bacterium]
MDRDRRIVRRALLAGLLVWVALAALLVGATVRAGLGGRQGAMAAFLALCFGSATSSLWLLLALVLDAFASQPISRRRQLWTAATVLFTMISPVLVLGAQAPA